jgi:7-cyano-7-deazaguanine synthase
MAKSAAIVLSSGGIHSLVCAGLATREFRVGMLHLKDQRSASKQALDAFERQVGHFKPLKSWIVEAGYLRQMSLPIESAGMVSSTGSDAQAALIPYRELQLLSVAAGFAQQMKASVILWGVQYEQKQPDELARIMELVQVMNQLLEMMVPEAPVMIKTPLMGLEDQQVIELGYQMGLPFQLSWSCQLANHEMPCMSCPACARRIRMFRAAQLADPLVAKKAAAAM